MPEKQSRGAPGVRRWVAWTITATAWIAFLLLFQPLVEFAGTGSAAILIFIPVGAASWVFGIRGGLVAAVAALGVNALGLWIVEGSLHDLTEPGYIIGHGVLTVFGVTVGYALETSRKYRGELAARRAAEVAASSAAEEFLAAFEGGPVAMAMTDSSGRLARVNRAFEAVTGRAADALLGEPFSRLIHADGVAAWKHAAASLATAPSIKAPIDLCITRDDGETVWVAASLTLIGRHPSQRTRILVHLADVTERRTTLAHLEELVRKKDQFVASVSHELRTPLTTVLGLANELATSPGGWSEAEQSEIAGLISTSSQELSNIVEDLLVAAKADVGAVGVNRTVVQLDEEARSVISVMGRAGDLDISVEGRAGAIADRRRVRQIIRNLITNAHRYGGDRVWIQVDERDGRAVLEVCDDGEGVPDADAEAIFGAYVRASVPEPTSYPGSLGLGLAVSGSLAALMGGRLTYRRDGPNTVFGLALPKAPVRLEAASSSIV